MDAGEAAMALRFFTVPVQDTGSAEAEVNSFLSNHKVLSVDRRWVDLGTHSFWAFCVDYLPSGSDRRGSSANAGGRSRIDYKDVLTPDEFTVVSQLRELRKEIAQTEAIPVYTVFTNEQLAQFVQQRCRSRADLGKIDGVGEARIEKYGEPTLRAMLTLLYRASGDSTPDGLRARRKPRPL
jgi:superfamily II DNA helicase RecQ